MGEKIRKFFRELFGSRLVEHLEVEILNLRNDADKREQVLKDIIADLRSQIALQQAKLITYEQALMAFSTKPGMDVVRRQNPAQKPNFPDEMFTQARPLTQWQKVQRDHEEQMRREAEEEAKSAKAGGVKADGI